MHSTRAARSRTRNRPDHKSSMPSSPSVLSAAQHQRAARRRPRSSRVPAQPQAQAEPRQAQQAEEATTQPRAQQAQQTQPRAEHAPQVQPARQQEQHAAVQQRAPTAPAATATAQQQNRSKPGNNRSARRSRRDRGSNRRGGRSRAAAHRAMPPLRRIGLQTGLPTIAPGRNAAAMAVITFRRPNSVCPLAASTSSASVGCLRCIWAIRSSPTAGFHS